MSSSVVGDVVPRSKGSGGLYILGVLVVFPIGVPEGFGEEETHICDTSSPETVDGSECGVIDVVVLKIVDDGVFAESIK
jgi:hypothetical protein